MYFKQFYLGCLAHASYLIGDEGQAVVVDPQRDVDEYLEEASKQGLKISHVIETHLHADFVSGHRELAKSTGAKIYFGSHANAEFEHVAVKEGDELRIGKVALRFLETPGHTPESISIVVTDEAESKTPFAVLTGDTLFIGDVGRPDLLGARMSASELAGMLYDSLHNKLLKLPDSVKVFPAHGAGSMCGRNISSERSSTIGEQRKMNYALQPMKREEFVRMMTTDLPEAPAYFSEDAQLNRRGPAIMEELSPPKPLSAEEVNAKRKDCLILDTRPSDQFGVGHIPGSLNIGLGGQFASWAGTLIPLNTPFILVAENEERVKESRMRLARVGHEKVIGYLDGGMLAWDKAGFPAAKTEQITVQELQLRIDEGSVDQVLDVRRIGEWNSGHIRQAVHIPLNHLAKDVLSNLNPDKKTAAICAGGYRSSMATSILEQLGYTKISNVIGGMNAWNSSKLEVVN
jgi:glyoxylase-like metal-dependent hydrolase (beta-lactamase superfamily II)/3-mercaptopyruvate sulfurtransferase SseA